MGEGVSGVNRAHWDVWAAAHGQDAYYDTAGLVAGADSLTDVERGAVGEVEGLDVLHVQCHIGFDAISLARSGARVTGVDFSPVALEKGRALAERCGVDVRFVEADATDLPERMRGRFDLAYAAYGILCWIADVDAWMRSVAATLRPGGRLVLVDFHPLLQMVETVEPLVLDFPYAFDGPHEYASSGSYATETGPTTSVEFAHSLGEIVTAAAAAGLRVTRLDERLDSALDLGRGTPVGPDGRHRFPVDGRNLPVLYALTATR
ncbi:MULTISPECIES: class I SAM-dependent methyltransferase [Actinomadura]|uniref:Methyltransferase domain-containing protein n=1 Tax=Actinomadura litoris TaxID=2678616 RepID=A0A7K1L2G9_9ACTN|nr:MULTISPECIES: class I SAM-dependent methyltransferase [Actinomadura]MBT2208839.1 methyltransferase domain-containing protein [Actinomadura sp. NEAU-AAG7]MUN38602.1 methyltransferase domain-containing protein [Actinomadura litoris]